MAIKNSEQILELTPKGNEMASFSKKKPLVLLDFLKKIGVPDQVAATDVEEIEHFISLTTLKALESHIQKLLSPSKNN